MNAPSTSISPRPAKTRLTDRGIRALRPDPGRTIDYPDTEVPGLRVRVTPAGVKSFGLRFEWEGKTRRKDYGRCFVELSLGKARELARADRQRLRDGIDPTFGDVKRLQSDQRRSHIANNGVQRAWSIRSSSLR